MSRKKIISPFVIALRAIMARQGLTCTSLARSLGVTPSYVHQIATGYRCSPAVAAKMADQLGLTGPERTGFLLEGVLATLPPDLASEMRGADADAATAALAAAVAQAGGSRACELRRLDAKIAALTRQLGDLAGEVHALTDSGSEV